jgi:hypothetical protein
MSMVSTLSALFSVTAMSNDFLIFDISPDDILIPTIQTFSDF